jgi:hypothetical protein
MVAFPTDLSPCNPLAQAHWFTLPSKWMKYIFFKRRQYCLHLPNGTEEHDLHQHRDTYQNFFLSAVSCLKKDVNPITSSESQSRSPGHAEAHPC